MIPLSQSQRSHIVQLEKVADDEQYDGGGGVSCRVSPLLVMFDGRIHVQCRIPNNAGMCNTYRK